MKSPKASQADRLVASPEKDPAKGSGEASLSGRELPRALAAVRRALCLPSRADRAEAKRLTCEAVACSRQPRQPWEFNSKSVDAWRRVLEHCSQTGYSLKWALQLKMEGSTAIEWLFLSWDYQPLIGLMPMTPKTTFARGKIRHYGNVIGFNDRGTWQGIGLIKGDRGGYFFGDIVNDTPCGIGVVWNPQFFFYGHTQGGDPGGYGTVWWNNVQYKGLVSTGMQPDGRECLIVRDMPTTETIITW